MIRAGRRTGLIGLLTSIALSAACMQPGGRFSESNARAHLNMLAGTIGSRAIGTDANRRARDYLIDQLRIFGFDVRVQDADATRPDLGFTARVSNIIAARNGARSDAIALVAHYDSAANAPGGTDDGFGVAVCLEAARLLGARANPVYSLVIAFTDGEEAGLMGAAALVEDPVFRGRVRAVLNFDSIGSSGPTYLFETASARQLVAAWASSAPLPRGGSESIEIYTRLPNDTDFTLLRRLDVAGLNFAPVDDSYAYHTARDTPERVSAFTLRQTGDNTIAIVEALDRGELTGRDAAVTYFDIANRRGLTYGRTTGRVLAAASLLLGALGCIRLFRSARDLGATGRLVFTEIWLLLGMGAAAGAMVGATWALRVARETFHPWYADPARLFLLLVTVAVVTAWALVRIAALLPRRFRGSKNPGFIWCAVLPLWMLLTALVEWKAPGAAYLWTLPLLTAGIVVNGLPPAVPLALRTGSVLVLAVAGTLWIPTGTALLRFVVAVFGRLPIVTPVWVYPAMLAMIGIMVGPPVVTIAATPERRLKRPSVISALLMVALAVTAALAYASPAYDYSHPARRQVQFVQDGARGQGYWEVAGLEPGLDLLHTPESPADWHPAPATLDTSVPVPPLTAAFRFLATAPPVEVPGTIAARLRYDGGRTELEITVRAEPPADVWFVMPPGVIPADANLPGRLRGARWIARYAAPPPEGVAFRASIPRERSARLVDAAVVLWTSRLPGGTGWQGLTPWLPQEAAVWTARAAFIQPLGPLLAIDTPAPPAAPLR
jgi:peptidase M28-like protein